MIECSNVSLFQRDLRNEGGYACLRRLTYEIAFMSAGPRTHSGRSTLFSLSCQDEDMDVDGPGNTGSIPQDLRISGNGCRPVDNLFVQGIKSFDFEIDLV